MDLDDKTPLIEVDGRKSLKINVYRFTTGLSEFRSSHEPLL